MNNYYLLLKLAWQLGFSNIGRVLLYRLQLKTGYFYSSKKVINLDEDFFYLHTEQIVVNSQKSLHFPPSIVIEADKLQLGEFKLFFHQRHITSSPPYWFLHPEYASQKHWSNIAVNSITGHDIKLTWDLSRFHWAQIFAAAYKSTGNVNYIHTLTSWCKNWLFHNPLNWSVNWVCAQECSIRLIHLINAQYIINNNFSAGKLLKQVIFFHCQRIELTLSYSIAQDNNHGTSEAAGLYIGGAWLAAQTPLTAAEIKQFNKWQQLGRKILENRINYLIAEDGSFSMYSTNYHRVVLNTLAMVEFWRKIFNLTPLPDFLLFKCQALTRWLYLMADELTGQVPNLGTNDGSNPYIVQITLDYTDYRPSIQFAAYQFYGQLAYKFEPAINEPLTCLGINSENLKQWNTSYSSQDFIGTGLVVLRPRQKPLTHAFLKYPAYRFRPSQADLMHFDLWKNGKNILCDAGTYSYFPFLEKDAFDFSSIKAHNTIQIDDREPMPKISSFLYGNWCKTINKKFEFNDTELFWQGSYQWPEGACHQRIVQFQNDAWIINDRVYDAKNNIILRWRLLPAMWKVQGSTISTNDIIISIQEANNAEFTLTLTDSYAANYYNSKQIYPMILVIAKTQQINFITTIKFQD